MREKTILEVISLKVKTFFFGQFSWPWLTVNDIFVLVGRTFPTYDYFVTRLGPGQLGLFNVLKAYSLLDKEVGYCQGLSFVVGLLLMHVRLDLFSFNVYIVYMFYKITIIDELSIVIR